MAARKKKKEERDEDLSRFVGGEGDAVLPEEFSNELGLEMPPGAAVEDERPAKARRRPPRR